MSAVTLKLLGGALLVAAGALLGGEKRAELRRRLACLRELCAALGRAQAELETLQSPLGELLSRLTDCEFFRLVAADFGSEDFAALWRKSAQALPLAPEEIDALAAPGAVLGRCDARRACAELALARAELGARADALEREIAGRGRRYAALGAALGAIVATVLF